MPSSLLYICCPPAERRDTEQLLKTAGFAPRWAETAAEALAALEQRQSVVLADFADARTARIVGDIRRRRPATFMMAISDANRQGVREEIDGAGVPVVLHRPLDVSMLSLLFAGVTAHAAEPGRGPQDPPRKPIFGESQGMRAALAAVERAAAQPGGVLVCGEAGTGRRMLAREIHDRASAGAPFVHVDCSEGSVEDLELRLFGTSDPGANAPGDRRRFERVSRQSALLAAQKGTLFLAHLREAPARVQARLVRVLRDAEVVVGESRHQTPLDVRPIASSDPEWDAAVADGRVRADLAKRVAAIRVDVPPLRERREDMAQLAACLLHRACARQRVSLKTIDPPALALLTALPWRGNVSELAELLDVLVSRAPGIAIRLEDVLAAVRLDGSPRPLLPSGTLREARARFERDYIAAVLQHHRGRMGEAARTLGIQRTNLYRKMRTLKVNWRTGNGATTADATDRLDD